MQGESPYVYGLALCAGAAGLELGIGLVEPELRTVCYVEREAYPAANLAAKMDAGWLRPAPIWDDLRTFDGAAWRGCVDLVTAGYPCQPWSVAGKREGERDPRHLWPDVLRILLEADTPLGFFENVGRHLSQGLTQVASDLEENGYRVATTLVNASDIGAPHKRERVFILACKLADPRSERLLLHRECDCEEPAVAGQSRGDADGCDADVEHACESGWQGRVSDEDQRRPRSVDGRAGSDRRGPVPDTERRELHEQSRRREGASRSASAELARIGPQGAPTFPPRPDDADGWRAFLERFPGSEPAVRRDAHGLAHRVDRLRLTGNGVVPQQAAFAYCVLRDAMAQELQRFGGA